MRSRIVDRFDEPWPRNPGNIRTCSDCGTTLYFGCVGERCRTCYDKTCEVQDDR
jgi:hypothetical protein